MFRHSDILSLNIKCTFFLLLTTFSFINYFLVSTKGNCLLEKAIQKFSVKLLTILHLYVTELLKLISYTKCLYNFFLIIEKQKGLLEMKHQMSGYMLVPP